MKTIRFTAYPDGYRCNVSGDQSGEYVKYSDVKVLLYEAYHALRAYQDGIESPQLAQKTANTIASHLLL